MTEYFYILTVQTSGLRATITGTAEAMNPEGIFKIARAAAVKDFNLSSRQIMTVEYFDFWDNSGIQ